jgi:hypothetical protein
MINDSINCYFSVACGLFVSLNGHWKKVRLVRYLFSLTCTQMLC